MTTDLQKMIGSGIYTISEAAMYARVRPQLLTRWLFGGAGSDAVISPQFDTSDRMVSFLDLVQCLAIREIRMQRKILLKKFRQAIEVAKTAFKLDYPFATKHVTYL